RDFVEGAGGGVRDEEAPLRVEDQPVRKEHARGLGEQRRSSPRGGHSIDAWLHARVEGYERRVEQTVAAEREAGHEALVRDGLRELREACALSGAEVDARDLRERRETDEGGVVFGRKPFGELSCRGIEGGKQCGSRLPRGDRAGRRGGR